MKIKPPSFIIIPYQLVADRRVKPIEQTLYGVIYWLTRLKNEKCTASNETLGELVQTTAGVVKNSLLSLEQRGYIKRTFKDRNKRVRDEIFPLIDFNTIVPVMEPEKKKEVEPAKAEPIKSEEGGEVNQFMELFKPVNPSYERLFANTTQRAALERLLKKYGKEKVEGLLKFMAQEYGNQFAPVITTPLQLEVKLGALVSHYKRKKAEGPKMVTI